MDDDRALDAVGPRLRELRRKRDVTLAELAAQTGIAASTLSRLESGNRRPTLEQLLPLARAHGVTLDELVDAPQTGDPRIHLRPISCADGVTILPLTRRPGGIRRTNSSCPDNGKSRNPIPGRTRATSGPMSSMDSYDWCSASTT